MAHRFIVGEDPKAALGDPARPVEGRRRVVGRPAGRGDGHAGRGPALRRPLRGRAGHDRRRRRGPGRPARQLEADSAGPLPRANLSVKVSALTPLLRPDAPVRGQRDAADRLRPLLRRANERGAHLHIDMESMDSRDAVAGADPRACSARTSSAPGRPSGWCCRATCATRRRRWTRSSSGCKTPRARAAADDPARQGRLLGPRAGAGARSTAGRAPVFERKADTDANFEQLTRRLLDARPLVRPAIASHNLRSVAHAIAYNRLTGGERRRPRAAGPARPRRPAAGGDRRPGPARAHLLPGRRPRGRHGLPGPPAAGEHLQRELPLRAGARRPARGRCSHRHCPPPSASTRLGWGWKSRPGSYLARWLSQRCSAGTADARCIVH